MIINADFIFLELLYIFWFILKKDLNFNLNLIQQLKFVNLDELELFG